MTSCEILDFDGGGSCPVQYFLDYEGHEYFVCYRHGWLTIQIDDMEVFAQRIGNAYDGTWSDEHTTVYLSLISEGIRTNSIVNLELPEIRDAHSHPMFLLGPLPKSHVIQCEQHHTHTLDCYSKETYSPIQIRSKKKRRITKCWTEAPDGPLGTLETVLSWLGQHCRYRIYTYGTTCRTSTLR